VGEVSYMREARTGRYGSFGLGIDRIEWSVRDDILIAKTQVYGSLSYHLEHPPAVLTVFHLRFAEVVLVLSPGYL
jgi:hypothetical protein